MSERARKAVKRWQDFADSFTARHGSDSKPWREYITGNGYVDEQRVIQPVAFPAFAATLLNWTVGENLAPEESDVEGKPDFTPEDAATHPFVFETKGTKDGPGLAGHDSQVLRYLTDGAPRIRKVVLTNLVGIRVFSKAADGTLQEDMKLDLRAFLQSTPELWAANPQAEALADFFEQFSRKQLTPQQKIEKVRAAEPWNPDMEVTNGAWVLARLDRVVDLLTQDAAHQIQNGALESSDRMDDSTRELIHKELVLLYSRIANSDAAPSLKAFLAATPSSNEGKALRQFASHVAYYAATRLVLVRTWEDLGLLDPFLYDGGFDRKMNAFDDAIANVVAASFVSAQDRYFSLFSQSNNYTWFKPGNENYAQVIYELANTYFGAIESDVLGQVYERMLERVDRKLAGVYYTPRDIIALIWDLIGLDDVAHEAEADERAPRVLDIATGSGGFLVEAAHRLRERHRAQVSAGATLTPAEWIKRVTAGLTGVEYQRFSAYLAELNLIVQMGRAVDPQSDLGLPPVGILNTDTLSLHNPDTLIEHQDHIDPLSLLVADPGRTTRARRVQHALNEDYLMDVACGNPPYIGERLAAPLLRKTRDEFPYWNQFVGQHMDYLYWFLILGVSKLREGGRFGFITTEYWLRSAGAKPLRKYLSANCEIDRIVLFRNFRLFPDAPGQDSMIVTGRRITVPDGSPPADEGQTTPTPTAKKPRVSIVTSRTQTGDERARILTAIRGAKTTKNVTTFTASASPNTLKDEAWQDCALTPDQYTKKRTMAAMPRAAITVTKGVETTVNALNSHAEEQVTASTLAALGGPGCKAGIQLLKQDEVAALGTLNQQEQETLRTVINTRDVYPYAAIVPPGADRVIYLAAPAELPSGVSDSQIVETTPFPPGLPHIEQHLNQFRTLLTEKTTSRGERRPWWSLHRPRPDALGTLTPATDRWSPFALTSRWGVGGALTVGLAPRGVSPASGLHILRPTDDGVTAAYLVAVYNSTLFQALVAGIPPGQIRVDDLTSLGMPKIAGQEAELGRLGYALAQTVTDLIKDHAEHFPELPSALRSDLTLTDWPRNVWTPTTGPSTSWGTLTSVTWIDASVPGRGRSQQPDTINVDTPPTLMGEVIELKKDQHTLLTIHIQDGGEPVKDAVAAAIRGQIAQRASLADIASMPMPISHATLTQNWNDRVQQAQSLIRRYQADRASVDAILNTQ